MTTDGAIPPALDGATTALQRRIEELTAERGSLRELTVELQGQLDAWLATTWQTPEQALGCIASWKAEEESWAEESARLRKDLATERAAREQDNEAFEELRRKWNESERERGTALDRVKSAEAETCTALDREIKAIDALNKALPFVDRALAAETAQASARPVLDALAEYIRALRSDDPKDDDANAGELEAAYDAWLTLHPSLTAPVAAPAPGLLERIEQVVHGWGPGTEYDTAADAMDAIAGIISYAREAPVAAPCAGCEAARVVLQRVKQECEPALSDLPDDAETWLKEHT